MKLKLQILQENDVNQSYLDWYQNEKVVRYSDNQYRSFSIEEQKRYVKNCLASKDEYFSNQKKIKYKQKKI